jgi:broad specificity phosphatase PhoE
VSRHQGNVLLVSHRVVIKVLICYLLGLDNSHFRNINQDVGGITIFDYADGRFVLTRHVSLGSRFLEPRGHCHRRSVCFRGYLAERNALCFTPLSVLKCSAGNDWP